MPFKAVRRHQYWTIDIRYLDHTLDEDKIYCISILENFSRAVVASALSRRQDLTTVGRRGRDRQRLGAAISQRCDRSV
jgi:hypothetical protein